MIVSRRRAFDRAGGVGGVALGRAPPVVFSDCDRISRDCGSIIRLALTAPVYLSQTALALAASFLFTLAEHQRKSADRETANRTPAGGTYNESKQRQGLLITSRVNTSLRWILLEICPRIAFFLSLLAVSALLRRLQCSLPDALDAAVSID